MVSAPTAPGFGVTSLDLRSVEGDDVAGAAQLDLWSQHVVRAVVDHDVDARLERDRRVATVEPNARREPESHPGEEVRLAHDPTASSSRSMCRSLLPGARRVRRRPRRRRGNRRSAVVDDDEGRGRGGHHVGLHGREAAWVWAVTGTPATDCMTPFHGTSRIVELRVDDVRLVASVDADVGAEHRRSPAELETRAHQLELRAFELVVVAELEELAGREPVVERPGLLEADGGELEARVIAHRGVAVLLDGDAERHDGLAHLDDRVGSREQRSVGVLDLAQRHGRVVGLDHPPGIVDCQCVLQLLEHVDRLDGWLGVLRPDQLVDADVLAEPEHLEPGRADDVPRVRPLDRGVRASRPSGRHRRP